MRKLIPLFFIFVLFTGACTRKTNTDYLQAANTAFDNYEAAVENLDGKIDEFQANQSLLQDEAWTADMLQVLADLKTAGDAFKNLPEPSTDLVTLDSLLVLAADQTDAYVESMNTAINNKDVTAIDNARTSREAIGVTMDDIQNELIRFLS
jgi:hypothetical protein